MHYLNIVVDIYKHMIELLEENVIPIELRQPSLIGTVQDDPFDHWIEQKITESLQDNYEVFHSGSLTTPDIIVRDKTTGALLGLEVKKLIAKRNGNDPRGMTIDYNSSLPCGTTLIRLGKDTVEIPCFYLFAHLDNSSESIITLLIMDGDFLNYDFNLHKKAKFANTSEYNHGPYGEGSVRHRRMYTYPNPLNSKLSFFHCRHILIAKKHDLQVLGEISNITEFIVREDIHDNEFQYCIKDITTKSPEDPPVLRDVFSACKKRTPRDRTPSLPTIPAAHD